ncbi:hypothetical protein [Levilactobacillus lindianensis]|uniref:hypothetical protein n=1 Tax=Levilactobacillus lindianensis TaxID=2486018 RepID=UPI000F745033|nr:hypothetical protein [Levilactobacillus lindianensis]
MPKALRQLIFWWVMGGAVSWYAIVGSVTVVYRIFSNEPVTLSVGIGLSVISLIGLSRAAKRGSAWGLVPSTVIAIALLLGLVADATLLGLGATIPGFY